IVNIVFAEEDLNTWKQAVKMVDQLQDNNSASPMKQFTEDNQNLSPGKVESIIQIPYYRERIKTWENSQTKTLGTVKFKMGNIVGNAHGIIQTNRLTGKTLPGFCMGGDRDAAIYTYQLLKVGQVIYLVHSWWNELWQLADNDWQVATIIIQYSCSQNTAIMFFKDKKGIACELPCGVAHILYKREGDKIITTFFDCDGSPTELDNDGYRISRVKATLTSFPSFYLDNQLLDMKWSKMKNWREMMIYFLWSYGDGIDWPD
ncbi:MAG: hypothetical protein LUE13_06125, partial [Akkermansiaceae bacterium]|nr:hypothetical protein [Akkermansiaceae bacterium]